jgi:uncharacterized protein
VQSAPDGLPAIPGDALIDRSRRGAQRDEAPGAAADVPSNAELVVPYFLPYAAYVAVPVVAGGIPPSVGYVLRLAAAGGLLLAFRRRYRPIGGPRPAAASVAIGALAGLVGAAVWVALVAPFQDPSAGEPLVGAAFVLRLAAAVLVVPFAEELLCRGYILGVLTQWQQARRSGAPSPVAEALDGMSIHTLAGGAWTAVAVAVSSAAFALGHAPAHWLAAFGFGLLMAALWIVRRDLIAPIVAHATTNLVLYLYIYVTGSWGLW